MHGSRALRVLRESVAVLPDDQPVTWGVLKAKLEEAERELLDWEYEERQ